MIVLTIYYKGITACVAEERMSGQTHVSYAPTIVKVNIAAEHSEVHAVGLNQVVKVVTHIWK